jgi:hypothetical protein
MQGPGSVVHVGSAPRPLTRQGSSIPHSIASPWIARRGIESSTKLGRHRRVAERDLAWLHRNRRLLVRYERDPELHDAFHLGSALICWQLLTRDS